MSAIAAVYVESIPDAGPGAIKRGVCLSGAALVIRCPGCSSIDSLPLQPFGQRGHWTMTGDPEQPGTFSLHPSVHHAADLGGCGWHGFLRNGRWEPC